MCSIRQADERSRWKLYKGHFFSVMNQHLVSVAKSTLKMPAFGVQRDRLKRHTSLSGMPQSSTFFGPWMNGSEVIGPYFFSRDTVDDAHADYVNMLRNWLVPRLRDSKTAIFQQDGAPPHWSLKAISERNFPQSMDRKGNWCRQLSYEMATSFTWYNPIGFLSKGLYQRVCLHLPFSTLLT